MVGRRPTKAVRELATVHPWVELHEDVADLAPFYLQARCVVLPIRSGGGTKLKVYEALAYGIPLIATSDALAGVPVTPGVEAIVADGAAELAIETARLVGDVEQAGIIGAAGRAAFVERLSWERAARKPLDALLRSLLSPSKGLGQEA